MRRDMASPASFRYVAHEELHGVGLAAKRGRVDQEFIRALVAEALEHCTWEAVGDFASGQDSEDLQQRTG